VAAFGDSLGNREGGDRRKCDALLRLLLLRASVPISPASPTPEHGVSGAVMIFDALVGGIWNAWIAVSPGSSVECFHFGSVSSC
jgi:hypothetical protein